MNSRTEPAARGFAPPPRSAGPVAPRAAPTTALPGPADAPQQTACRQGPSPAGLGRVEFALVAGRTEVTAALAHAPLKLLAPRPRAGPSSAGGAACVYASTYGGGLVAGDDLRLTLRAGPGTAACLATQASTKIYPARATPGPAPASAPCFASAASGCRQSLDATIEAGAMLAVLPDPVTCFAGARYQQRQRFDLVPGASLVVLDWLTSGRQARGERWAFASCRTRAEVFLGDDLIFTDALALEVSEGSSPSAVLSAPHRLGRLDCLATAVVVGPHFAAGVEALLTRFASAPLRRDPGGGPLRGVLFAASAIRGGAVIRAAGPGAEAVGYWLRQALAFVPAALGTDPWSRKY